MDIELLKTFLEVNKTRHFGKASENLYLTQAAVSARIKLLEENLGVILFIRARNNIQLTTEGERLVPHAETMLLAWSRARQEVALKKEQSHQLSLGTTTGLWQHVLQNKLGSITQQFPELALRADALSEAELTRFLQEGTVDIGLLYEPLSLAELSVKPIGKLKLVLASTDPTISAKDALKQHYIYVDWGTAFEIFHARKHSDAAAPALHTNMASIAETYLRQCGGSAYLPASSLPRLVDAGISAVKHAPSFSKDVYALYKSDFKHPQLLQSLLSLIKL